MTNTIYSAIEPLYYPEYTTPWAAWWDLRTRLNVIVPSHSTMKIPTWLKVALPDNHVLLVEPRSSTLTKKWLLVNVWVIDSDFRWEIQMVVHNLTDNPVKLEQWERIAQAIIIKTASIWAEVFAGSDYDNFDKKYPTERKGWFWSTWDK